MTGVLLINMGSPLSKPEMKEFLFNMFSDKRILPFSNPKRTFVASMISTFRYSGSWKKYELIGGSKLIDSMNKISRQLEDELGKEYNVLPVYSYTKPYIQKGVEYFNAKGIFDVKTVTMYPHESFSTTGSVRDDLEKSRQMFPDMRIADFKSYATHPDFIKYWVELIEETIQRTGFKNPTLVFSGHAIPMSLIKNGDTYADEISLSSKLISEKLSVPFKVAYQSKIGRIEWTGPDTKDCLQTLRNEGVDEIILVPISFVNENLETAYDQDIEIIPFAKNELQIQKIDRVTIPVSNANLINLLKKLLIES